MIWGDGGALSISLAVVWVLSGLITAGCYTAVIGRRVLKGAKTIHRRIWGAFIYACGLGHFLMVIYMAFLHTFPMWVAVVVIDFITMAVTIEAAWRSPDVPNE